MGARKTSRMPKGLVATESSGHNGQRTGGRGGGGGRNEFFTTSAAASFIIFGNFNRVAQVKSNVITSTDKILEGGVIDLINVIAIFEREILFR